MKIALITDTHFGARNDNLAFNDYFYEFWEKTFFPYIEENGIDTVIHLGDVMDRRKFVSYKIAQDFRKRFIQRFVDKGVTLHMMVGNHDTFYKNTNDLNALKELLGHYMGEVTIHMDPTVLNLNGFKLALLPWVCSENYDKSLEFIKTCKADWLGGHLELQGFDVLKGVQAHAGMDHKIFSRFEKVISGHFHTASRQDNVWYLGSQMEFFWSDAGDKKGFHILDTETRELEKIHNPHTLFKKVLYNLVSY